MYQTCYFICNEFRCGIANNDRFHGLKFGVSICTGSCWKDSQINNGQEPLCPITAAKQAQSWGVSVTGRQQVEVEGVSSSWLHLCHHSPRSYLAPAYSKELFQLPVGPVLVTAGQTPGCQGEHWVLWGPSQTPLHPRPPQSCGVSIRTALGMAVLENSNVGRAVTAPAVPHMGSNPAFFS